MIDLGTWLLITALAYPLIGLALYSISLVMVSNTKIREIDSRYPGVPIWMMIVVTALTWPLCLVQANRKGTQRAVLDRQRRVDRDR